MQCHPNPNLLQPLLLGVATFALTACSGGGGGASPATNPGTGVDNSGSFSQSDFDYQDPHDPSFHPLGLDSAVLTRFEELMILSQPYVPAADTRATIFDDIGAGAGVLGSVPAIAGAGTYVAAAAGALDDDGADELAMVRLGSGGSLDVITIEADPNGAYGVAGSFNIPASGFPYADVQLELADVDGDFRDEYVFSARDEFAGTTANAAWLRVYDDDVQGNLLLHDLPLVGAHSGAGLDHLTMVGGDLDGDGRDEVGVLALRRVGGSRTVQIQVFENEAGAFVDRIPWGNVQTGLDRRDSAIRLVAGDFDGVDADELVVGTYTVRAGLSDSGECRLIRYRLEQGLGELVTYPSITLDEFVSPGISPAGGADLWDIVALDTGADRIDEVAVLMPDARGPFLGNGANVITVEWTGGAWHESFTFGAIPSTRASAGFGRAAARLHATDDDGDGQDEAYLAWVDALDFSEERHVARLDWGSAGAPVTQRWTSNLPTLAIARRPVLAAPELDCEGLTVRFTGNKFTSLADPKRLALLTAPPTKDGISQNYTASSTRYSVATASGQTYGVTSGISASVYAGFDLSDLTDSFGVSARHTIEGSVTKSQHETTSVTVTQGFSGPADSDVIVFQGTLYHCYEYVVEGATDPNVVGTVYTLDVPVRTRVYKWTVDYFNANVAASYRIGSELLPHTIGDPASYRPFAEVEALAGAHVGWMTGASPPATVGNSTATTDIAIELQQQSTTTEERSIAVTTEAGFTVAGTQFGGSFGVSSSSIYSVTVSETSTYEGVIGDISSTTDYEAWAYDYGLAVYHHGVLANGANQPTANVSGTAPFQIITYWTRPFGTAY